MTSETGSTHAPAPPGAAAPSRWSNWGPRMGLVLLPVSVDLVLRLSHPALHTTAHYRVGLALLALATVLGLALHRHRLPEYFVWMVPLLVLAAVGLLRLVPDRNGMGVLAVLVATWLGADRQARGVVVSAIAVLLALVVPAAAVYGAGAGTWTAAVQLTLVATLCAGSTAWLSQRWQAREQELEARERQLREALASVSAGQALNAAVFHAVDVGLVGLRRDGSYGSTNPHHERFLDLAFPEGHRGRAGQTGWVFDTDGTTFLARDRLPTVRASRGEEFTDQVIWVGQDPAERRALAVSSRRVEGAGDPECVLVYKDVTDLVRALGVKDDFVATVSHELRTPLTAILGFLDLAVLDTPDGDPRRGYLQVVHRNARRLLRLVNDLLLTAQAERGVLDLDQRLVDLSKVVAESVGDNQTRAQEVRVRLEVDLQQQLWVHGDQERLAEVVDNLLTNAVKYSHAGGTVRLTLQKDGGEDGGDGQPQRRARQAVITVSDDGIGIAEEEQQHLFTRFFRTQDAQQRAIQGIGLGLSISKSIVERHDGTIEVDSAAGIGTTFVVRLPLVEGPVGAGQGRPVVDAGRASTSVW